VQQKNGWWWERWRKMQRERILVEMMEWSESAK
jgi:hypothetical protein